MTALKRNRILSISLTLAMIGVIYLTTHLIWYKNQYDEQLLKYSALESDTSAELIAKDMHYLSKLSELGSEKKNVEDALETALQENALLLTLSETPMVDWTVQEILDTRELFDSIPYGSWFEDGHIMTGEYGSKALSATHWNHDGHMGVDIFPRSGNNNEIIQSVIDGRVVTWGRNDRVYGNYLVIESSDGLYQIKLAHLSSIAIFYPDGNMDLYEGMEFKRGTRIAKMGNTGKTTGPHLHVEYKIKTETDWRLLNANTIIDYMGE